MVRFWTALAHIAGWCLLFLCHGVQAATFCYGVTTSALITLSVSDWKRQMIPPVCNLVILGSGIVNLALHYRDWAQFLLGAALVSGLLYALRRCSGGAAIGGGDVKLSAAAGLLLGFRRMLLAFAIACILGAAVEGIRVRWKHNGRSDKGQVVAFGPYLSLGIYLMMLF
jgi:leader peptidase (prepilin peptidase)/N-methyltransferase